MKAAAECPVLPGISHLKAGVKREQKKVRFCRTF
jgi:hypothetical protein